MPSLTLQRRGSANPQDIYRASRALQHAEARPKKYVVYDDDIDEMEYPPETLERRSSVRRAPQIEMYPPPAYQYLPQNGRPIGTGQRRKIQYIVEEEYDEEDPNMFFNRNLDEGFGQQRRQAPPRSKSHYSRGVVDRNPNYHKMYGSKTLRMDRSANMEEQGNGYYGVTHSIDFYNQTGQDGKFRKRNEQMNQSALQIITTRIEEIKHSPSMVGCGKETILIILVIIAVIVSNKQCV